MAKSELSTARNLSVRLPQEAFDNVVALAKVEGITMGEVIRRAIAHYARAQMADPEWATKVEALQRQLAALLPPE
ncbi:MAG: ribbon-helix-helix protein, CopG family [Propionibacteriaceae bacterium]|nr:ribbon-helix-helix protein, CopG family [Propionibacteriaceae bacterium]